MLNLQPVADNVQAVRGGRMRVEEFQEWIADYVWGHRGAPGAGDADAIAALDMVLMEFDLGEFDQSEAGARLADAILPFVPATLQESNIEPQHP